MCCHVIVDLQMGSAKGKGMQTWTLPQQHEERAHVVNGHKPSRGKQLKMAMKASRGSWPLAVALKPLAVWRLVSKACSEAAGVREVIGHSIKPFIEHSIEHSMSHTNRGSL